MPSGYGVAGLAGGFGSGLANILVNQRQEIRRQDQLAEDRNFREVGVMLPLLMQQAIDNGDYKNVEDYLTFRMPHLKQLFKQESPFQYLGPLLQPQATSAATAPAMRPTTPDEQASLPGAPASLETSVTPPATLQPTRVAGIQEAPKTFFGSPVLTPQQRLERQVQDKTALGEADYQAKINIIKRLKAAGVDDETLDRIGLRDTTGSSPFQSVAGELPGGVQTFGTFNKQLGKYVDQNGQPLEGFRPRSTGVGGLGQEREAIARAKFNGRTFSQLSPPEQQQVLDEEVKRGGEKAATTTTAKMEASSKGPLSTKQKFDALTELQGAWRKAVAPTREMSRQLQLMHTGLERFKAGDKIGGSQAVLVTFQKILDPLSVVRESEYERSASGLGLMQRIQGAYEKLKAGGAGVPVEDLQQMVETADQFLQGMNDWNELERERITSTATDYGLNPERVFGVAAAAQKMQDQKAAPGAGGGAPQIQVDGKGNVYVNGKKIGG